MNNEIKKILDERKVKLVFDGDRGTISDFINDRSSQQVFNFLSTDKSWRVLFNAIVKTNWLDLSLIQGAFSKLSIESGCSITYEAACNCGATSDNPIIIKKISKTTFNKTITCKKCGEVKLDVSKYKPVSNVSEDNILKVLSIGKKKGFLGNYVSAHCFNCQITSVFSPAKEKIKCPKCGELRNVTVGFYPIPESLENLVKKQQGHWLEWYVYELLRKKFPTEYGLIYKENGSDTNIDVVCLKNNELWVIECKDSSDVANFIKNIKTLKKIADRICLLTTKNIDKKSLETIKDMLNSKFIYVMPKDIEQIPNLIAEANFK